ncbi:MAG: biopolymer transporter ExbD [Cytophagales bacterium]|nr:MAG: biopolymer transporter ExbD [Cytophagales bacterium]
MNLQPKNKLETGFSLASMTDIIFLLLIFFMLTSSIVSPTALPISLPKATSATQSNPRVIVTVTSKLEYFINNQPIEAKNIEVALVNELKKADEQKVLLNMDKTVPVEHLVRITAIANRLGAKVAIATQLEQKNDE